MHLGGVAMDRARSLPPEGSELERGNINPFYSRKLKDEMRLIQARPDSLPEAVSPVEFQPIRSEGVIGKGRGGSSTLLAASKGHGGSFVTPPSRRTQREITAANLELGMQNQRGGERTQG